MAPQSLTLGRADFNTVLVYGVTVWALLDGEEIIVSEYSVPFDCGVCGI